MALLKIQTFNASRLCGVRPVDTKHRKYVTANSSTLVFVANSQIRRIANSEQSSLIKMFSGDIRSTKIIRMDTYKLCLCIDNEATAR